MQTYIVGARGGEGVGIVSLHAHAVLCQQCAKVGGKRGMVKEKNTTSSGDDFTKNHPFIYFTTGFFILVFLSAHFLILLKLLFFLFKD